MISVTRPPEKPRPEPVTALKVPYERAVPWSARRGPFYLIVLLLFLNVVATTSITWGPMAMRDVRDWIDARRAAKQKAQADAREAAAAQAALARNVAAFGQCLVCEVPATQVVYSEEPSEVARLLRATQGYSCIPVRNFDSSMPEIHLPVVWQGPAELRKLVPAPPVPGGDLSGALFLHERHTRTGPPRLIWIHIVCDGSFENSRDASRDTYTAALGLYRSLHAFVLESPAKSAGADNTVWSYVMHIVHPADKQPVIEYPVPGGGADTKGRKPVMQSVGDRLRMLAGRADPTDPSRLAIDYTLEGRPGSIDVWLADDDRLRVEPHAGRKSVEVFDGQHGVEHWEPGGGKG